MVVVKLMGGLGNQMFQYAAGRSLAARFQVPLKLDLNWFFSEHGGTKREYALEPFKLFEECNIVQENCCVEKSLWEKFRSLWRKEAYKKYRVVREKSFCYDPSLQEMQPPVYLQGYWQSEKYFEEISRVIRSEFSCRELSSEGTCYLNEIQGSRIPVSLHVRRGDYVTNAATQKFHGQCSLEYYLAASNYILKEYPCADFYVFSDDLQWVRKNLSIEAPVSYVEVNGGAAPHEELMLMRACSHHIIANSSFSWWGAWLNEKENKRVIAPKRWFADSHNDTSDLVPSNWIRL